MQLPVITTRGIIVFPKHSIKLDIGRKISLNALDFAMKKDDFSVVLVSQKEIMKNDVTNEKEIFQVGTLVNFKIDKSYENGVKTIAVLAKERVKLTKCEFVDKERMILADFKILKSKSSQDSKREKALVNSISKSLNKTLGSMVDIPKNVLTSLASGIFASELADIVGHYLPLTLAKKQQMLETMDVNKRLELAYQFLSDENEINKIEDNINTTVKKTIDNQHREFILRERLKAIKEELGDISSKDSEVDKWRSALESKKFPERINEAVSAEISKYESTPPMAAESNVLKGYLDWIFSLPWKTYTQDNEDITKAKKMLDKNHYGLKKVKERIIEHLAVKMKTKSLSSPIITLVGPPGVGKTSLAKSIAEAINRKFAKVSLGGVKDESEIRGHRRTYVGAMPGKIIQAIKKTKSSNALILLDEIDKMSSDYKGDPTSAMLEVLDPEQNKTFQDHYLELEYDLSNVMFIATANYYDNIPSPLLDRVELIYLDQYTSEEKLEIAKFYIIPKVLKENGLSNSQFKMSDKTIEYIIDKYTLEAGVRGLQRVMEKIARKIVLQILEKKIKSSFTVTKEKVLQLLGKEEVFKEKLEGKSEVGVVNGMYYSSTGGGILPIEVTTFPAKRGGIKLTGSVKDIMQESLQIAIAYIRTNAKKFKINFDWEATAIQIHVPAGAVPKDGPSAGIAFTSAVISALTNKAVDKTIALTGEITLRGKILPIGGLKEKTIGAVEAGVKTIYVPKINEKDLKELANKVKNNAKIILVNNYSEVYKDLFA